jgi:aldehyde:ferredoxin oxidoreductase
MSTGCPGKRLHVNLSAGRSWIGERDDAFYSRYFGGRHWSPTTSSRKRSQRLILWADKLLFFAGGTLTGTPVSGAGRNALGASSPLTGAFGCAEVGGTWGVS